MVLKLYGSSYSTCTKRVAMVLREKEVPFEFVSVAIERGAQKAPTFLAHQPFGQVPYIVVSGTLIHVASSYHQVFIIPYDPVGGRRLRALRIARDHALYRDKVRGAGDETRARTHQRQRARVARPCGHDGDRQLQPLRVGYRLRVRRQAVSPSLFLRHLTVYHTHQF